MPRKSNAQQSSLGWQIYWTSVVPCIHLLHGRQLALIYSVTQCLLTSTSSCSSHPVWLDSMHLTDVWCGLGVISCMSRPGDTLMSCNGASRQISVMRKNYRANCFSLVQVFYWSGYIREVWTCQNYYGTVHGSIYAEIECIQYKVFVMVELRSLYKSLVKDSW